MVQEVITNSMINEICSWLEDYDKTGEMPSDRIRINITLSRETLGRLNSVKNLSKYIEGKIFSS